MKMQININDREVYCREGSKNHFRFLDVTFVTPRISLFKKHESEYGVWREFHLGIPLYFRVAKSDGSFHFNLAFVFGIEISYQWDY